MGLVEEVTYNLTEVERGRLLKRADGMRPNLIAEEEGCSPQAVRYSIAAMIRKNEYCRIASEHGVLRRTKNQHETKPSSQEALTFQSQKSPLKATPIPTVFNERLRIDDALNTAYNYPEDGFADDGCPNVL